MNKEILNVEKQYLNTVVKQINSNITQLESFLNQEKQAIEDEKVNLRKTNQTHFDADDSFLDTQLRIEELTLKQDELKKLNRMKINPYFARIDVKELGGKDYFNYIGYRSLNKPDNSFYIIDWRAPFSSLFYDFDKGPFKYKTISGEVSGEILNKRQFKIENSELKYYFDAEIKVDDEILQETLSKNTTEKMKNIVATIQREQNQIIRCSEKLNTLVLGVAGSGKTSIALHRVAYLLYKLKGNLKSNEILILSPNEMFSSYISEVLPELNEDNALNTTFDEIIKNELGENVLFETKQEQIERKIAGKYKVDEEKDSYEFFVKLYNFVVDYLNKNFKPQNIMLGAYNIPASKINTLYFKNYGKFLPFKRVEWIIDNLIETYFSSFKKLEFKIQDFLNSKLYRMFKNNNPINIYKLFLESINKKFTLISKKIKHEDIISILFINYFIYGSIDYSSFKHVVIDEAQDYNAVQFYLLDSYFNCPKTIVGDVGQAIIKNLAFDNMQNLQNIFGISSNEFKIVNTNSIIKDEIIKLNLNKSYRSSYEITLLSNSILNRNDCFPIERSSKKPELIKVETKDELTNHVLNLFENYKRLGYNNIGIITKNLKSAKLVFNLLKEKIENINLINDVNQYFNGAVVLPAFSSKGLEFDAVIVFNVNSTEFSTELDRQLLYIATTRALHNLTLFYTNKPSKFVLNYFKGDSND